MSKDVEVVVIGSLTKDLIGNDLRLGGPAYYCVLSLVQLGVNTKLICSADDDLYTKLLKWGVKVLRCGFKGPIFRLTYLSNGSRRVELLRRGDDITLSDEEIEELSKNINVPQEKIKETVQKLSEFNPMLGFRGCRLGIVYPEIVRMQAQAIFEAAAELIKEGLKIKPEIMVPLVGEKNELLITKSHIDEIAQMVMKKYKVKIKYSVGTMIEVPRACLVADKIAEVAEFFSFGTNDLTQMTFGFSRDDAGRFLKVYLENKLLTHDPFVSIDEEGVGKIMKLAVELGRKTRKDLKIGICGEQGGDPQSVKFCHKIGLDYVSCSPFRVPIARLALAQATLEDKKKRRKKS